MSIKKFSSALLRFDVLIASILSLVTLCALSARAAGFPEGVKVVTLIAANGTRQAIGHVTLTPDGDGAAIAVVLDAPEFGEQFLSMRPFRCLPHTKEMWCHLAYPYATKGRISAGDLTDLEYALLFLFKPPAGYGIDAWNGLYFKLAVDKEGGFSGTLHEADFNVLAVPPDAGNLRPIPHSALTSVAPGAHRFAKVEIR